MSSPDPGRPHPEALHRWQPPDFDAATPAAATALLESEAVALAAKLGPAQAWTPPTLESPRSTPRPAPRGERERAYDEGFDAGLTAGRSEGEARVEPSMRALEQVVARFAATEAEFARERERNLTALALVVARKLVQHEFDARPALLQSLVAKALDLMPAGVPAEVRLHPADLEAMVPGIERLAVEGRGPAVQWVADPAVPRGGFMIEGPTRIVDGRVDSALRQLYERLDHD